MAGEYDIPLVRALGALVFPGAIDGSAEEMCAGVYTGCVYVIIFGEITHGGVVEMGSFRVTKGFLLCKNKADEMAVGGGVE